MNRRRLVKSLFILSIIFAIGSMAMTYGLHREPYPSLVFPGGPGTVKSTGLLKYRLSKLTAITDQGQRYPIRSHDLLSPVPRHYRRAVLNRQFGLPVSGPVNRTDAAAPSPMVSDGRAWLRRQLYQLIGQANVVMLEHITYRIDLPSRLDPAPPEAQVLSTTTIPLR